MSDLLDVLVIGAGQAGLAAGYFLRHTNLRFQLVDAAPEIGHVWQTRYDSLRLFTPAKRNALPGLPFPGDPEHYPGKDDVAGYLRAYARTFALPVQLATRVTRLHARDGTFTAVTDRGALRARQVVIAVGAFGVPFIPPFARHLDPGVLQLHSSAYRHPAQLPAGRVLVVGCGNSGAQIAEELTRTHQVTVALGRRQPRLPQRLLGRDIFDWSDRVRLFDRSVDTPLGAFLRGHDPLIGTNLTARKLKVRPRVTGAVGRVVHFEDGTVASFGAVVWATGYRGGYAWLDLPVLNDRGEPLHARGVTSVPGVYFLGLSWQHTRSSALLGGVGRDAEYLAERIFEEHHRRSARDG